MTKRDNESLESIEARTRACYSTWADTYFEAYYNNNASYPPVHVDLVRRQLAEAKARTVLDAGCGPASMMRGLADLNCELYGFDLTPQMVDEARRVMEPYNLAPIRLWQGSVTDPEAFHAPENGYDAVLSVGVLPHIPADADEIVLRNIVAATRPGGLVLIEARNQLFSLFTLNRYSREFFRSVLIREEELMTVAGASKPELQNALSELDERFRTDLPPLRRGTQGDPGYDEIVSRTHNPFELQALAEKVGLRDVTVLFYHFHCLPPMLEHHIPELFRQHSVAMENAEDWRGYFMASAFFVKGHRA